MLKFDVVEPGKPADHRSQLGLRAALALELCNSMCVGASNWSLPERVHASVWSLGAHH